MNNAELSPTQKKYLKGLAHSRNPVVQVGKEGLSAEATAAIDKALSDHELIKIRFLEASGLDRKRDAQSLAAATGSQCVQIIGKNIVLYRRHPDAPKIEMPA